MHYVIGGIVVICLLFFIVSYIRQFMDDPKEGMKKIGHEVQKVRQKAKEYSENQNNRNKE